MRVLISTSCSFSISRETVLRARELDASWASPDYMPIRGEEGCWLDDTDHNEYYFIDRLVPRHDPILLQVFDELGEKMVGDDYCQICCIDIPDDVAYFVNSYVGEWISEAHRIWSGDTGFGGEPGGSPVFTKNSKFSDFSP